MGKKMAKKDKKPGLGAEFKKFIARGNVLDMAVGVIVGGAFGNIVTSLVNDIIMPPIGLLLGKVNFEDLKIVLKEAVMEGEEVISKAVTINYGKFIQLILNFLIVAFCVFMVVKMVGKMREKAEAKKKAEEAAKAAEEAAKKAAEEAAKPKELTVDEKILAALTEISAKLDK